MPVEPLQLPAHDPNVKKIVLEGVSILRSKPNPNVTKVVQELIALHGIESFPILSIAGLMATLELVHIPSSSYLPLLPRQSLLIGSSSLVKRVLGSISRDYVPVLSKPSDKRIYIFSPQAPRCSSPNDQRTQFNSRRRAVIRPSVSFFHT